MPRKGEHGFWRRISQQVKISQRALVRTPANTDYHNERTESSDLVTTCYILAIVHIHNDKTSTTMATCCFIAILKTDRTSIGIANRTLGTFSTYNHNRLVTSHPGPRVQYTHPYTHGARKATPPLHRGVPPNRFL